MRAGPLRDRIDIQAPTTTKDAGGAAVVSYATVATRWGAVEELSARERIMAGATQARLSGRIRMRFYSGLATTHRLLNGSRTFGITAVINPDGVGREHVCDVTEVA